MPDLVTLLATACFTFAAGIFTVLSLVEKPVWSLMRDPKSQRADDPVAPRHSPFAANDDGDDGAAHKAYGAMPNSIFVIDTDGTVLYRSIWNNTDRIGDILSRISARVPVAPEELKAKPPLNFKAITVLLSGGLVATFDFLWGLRKLIAKHVKVGNM
jgi:hypothetical protein